MIKDILVSLKDYLGFMMPEGTHVVLDAVKKDMEEGEGDLVITLLRIEEETSRKPQNTYFKVIGDSERPGEIYQVAPDLDLNLEVLISAPTRKYETALTLISEVITFLNSIRSLIKPAEMSDESYKLLKSMHLSIMGLSFDQTLSMWQTLGGTLVPAVAYKIRMVTIPGLTDAGESVPVKEVDVQTQLRNPFPPESPE
jgi:hypothetical protein